MDLATFEEMRTKLAIANLSKPALVGLAAFIVMVAVLAGRNIIGTATATEIDLENRNEVSAIDDSTGSEEVETTIYVHVSGAVAAPGLYEVAEGSRVAEAIDSAGGFTEEAVPESVNLARKLEDGEMVVVASEESYDDGSSDGVSRYQDDARIATTQQLVNINTASAAELESLPGIGPSTAERIVSDRAANGAFKTVGDLTRVSGIGEKKLAALEGLICV